MSLLSSKFQSTLPRGERPLLTQAIAIVEDFNPLSRVGRDEDVQTYGSVNYISIHSPAWGETECGTLIDCILLISIHSPAWGETVTTIDDISNMDISIHSPAWGETQKHYRHIMNYYFNPLSRVGRDVKF